MATSCSLCVVPSQFSAIAPNRFSGQIGSIAYAHPEYSLRQWLWKFYRISYLGGREYLKPDDISIEYSRPVLGKNRDPNTTPVTTTENVPSLLFRHSREQQWEYENRRQRAHYYNFVASTVNSLVSHAVKLPPVRVGDTALEDFWAHADQKRQLTIDQMMRYGARWAQVFGLNWGVVDQIPEEQGGDGKPFMYWVSPLDIWDWHVGDDGEIEWLKQYVHTEAPRNWNQEIRSVARFNIWHRDRLDIWEMVDGTQQTLVETRPHTLGRVPFEPLYSRRQDDTDFPDGVPLAGDLCKIANSVFNRCSLVDEIYNKQTFAQLVIPDASHSIDAVQIGLNQALTYDPGAGGGNPVYISPPADNARVLGESIFNDIAAARQTVGVGRGRSEGSMQQASAEALELESDDKRSILADVANEMEDFEQRIAGLFDLYRAAPTSKEPTIIYSRQFDVRSFEAEIKDATDIKALPIPAMALTQLLKELLTRKFASLPPAELKAMMDAVEADQDDREQRADEMRDQLRNADDTADGDDAQDVGGNGSPNAGDRDGNASQR